MSPTLKQYYQRDYRTQYGANVGAGGYVKTFLDGTKYEIVEAPGMGSSQRIIASPKHNLHFGYNSFEDISTASIQLNRRAIEVIMDMKLGVNFGIISEVAVNDQA